MRARRDELGEAGGALVEALDAVVDEEHLAAAAELAVDGLAQDGLVVARHDGADGAAIDRRRGDDRHVAQAAHRHLEGARDGRGRQGEDVDVGLEGLDALLVGDAEALLLVDHEQAEPLEVDVLGEQAVGADHDVDAAVAAGRGRRRPAPAWSGSGTWRGPRWGSEAIRDRKLR